jgi:hypothetical protein
MCAVSDKGHSGSSNVAHEKLSRKRIWQLDGRLHCSVIGTCLTLDELRQMCCKAKITVAAPITDYRLHRAFVSIVGSSDYSPRLVQKRPDRKYKCAIKKVSATGSAQALEVLWQNSLDQGKIAGAFWALVTHQHVPDALIDRIYGEVHILSHLAGASIRLDVQELGRLRTRTRELEKSLVEMEVFVQRRLNSKDAVIQTLNGRLAQLLESEHCLRQAERRLSRLENDPGSRQLKAQIKTLSANLAAEQVRSRRAEVNAEKWQQSAGRSDERNLQLERRADEHRRERASLEETLRRLLSSACGQSSLDNSYKVCPRSGLSGRCVLYVGGRTSQCAHFRALVEQYQGSFLHHDGGREDGRLRLKSILAQSDAVFCPVDCISHDAINRIKRHCEQHVKPLVLMPRASRQRPLGVDGPMSPERFGWNWTWVRSFVS